MAEDRRKLPEQARSGEVQDFLRKLAATPAPQPQGSRGRLLFGMDATASREPTWDRACHIQGEMFRETAALGGLDVQLAFYRGFHEFKKTGWLSNSAELLRRMTSVSCLGGQTQIERLLRHAIAETRQQKVDALVFVAIGISGGIGHYLLVRAFELAPAAFVSPFTYGQIIGATLISYLVFGQLPDSWTWIGAAIVAASGLFILYRERLRNA